MEAKSVALALCFIGTVMFQCGAVAKTPTPVPSPTSSGMSSSARVSPTQSVTTNGSYSTSPNVTNQSNHTASTVANELGSSDELSAGEIVGIVIGSLAGVALIGGGIFGALKFTGKI